METSENSIPHFSQDQLFSIPPASMNDTGYWNERDRYISPSAYTAEFPLQGGYSAEIEFIIGDFDGYERSENILYLKSTSSHPFFLGDAIDEDCDDFELSLNLKIDQYAQFPEWLNDYDLFGHIVITHDDGTKTELTAKMNPHDDEHNAYSSTRTIAYTPN